MVGGSLAEVSLRVSCEHRMDFYRSVFLGPALTSIALAATGVSVVVDDPTSLIWGYICPIFVLQLCLELASVLKSLLE
jgi:hypothetical protein